MSVFTESISLESRSHFTEIRVLLRLSSFIHDHHCTRRKAGTVQLNVNGRTTDYTWNFARCVEQEQEWCILTAIHEL